MKATGVVVATMALKQLGGDLVAGETACYRILAYISLKMELHWRSNPVGKVRKNLPFFKELAYEHFTQKA